MSQAGRPADRGLASRDASGPADGRHSRPVRLSRETHFSPAGRVHSQIANAKIRLVPVPFPFTLRLSPGQLIARPVRSGQSECGPEARAPAAGGQPSDWTGMKINASDWNDVSGRYWPSRRHVCLTGRPADLKRRLGAQEMRSAAAPNGRSNQCDTSSWRRRAEFYHHFRRQLTSERAPERRPAGLRARQKGV